MNPNFTTKFKDEVFNCVYITTLGEAHSAITRYLDYDCLFGVDTETAALPQYRRYPKAALSPHLSTIRLFQVTNGSSVIVFDLQKIGSFEFLIPFLETKRMVAHYAMFDLKVFYNEAMRLGHELKKPNLACTFLLAKIIMHATRADDAGISLSLESCMEGFFNVQALKGMQITDWAVPELTFEQIEYAALDAIYVLKLAQKLAPTLQSKEMVDYYKLLKAVQHPVAKMELAGIGFNREKHLEHITTWRMELYKAKKAALDLTGLPDLTPIKMGKWLESNLPADILAIWPRSEKTNALTVDSNVLSDFGYIPAGTPFSEFQTKEKLTTSFGMSLQNQLNPATARLHSSYHICGARTGRFSCSTPNSQQYPRDKSFRELFVASPGNVLVVADYSTIEVRAAAELSKDPVMLSIFARGGDIYKETAARLNNIRVEDVTKEQRQFSKSLVLGLQFGLGAKKFATYAKRNLKVEVSEEYSSEQVKAYREIYCVFREWQLKQISDCVAMGFTSRTVVGKLRKYDPERAFGNVLNHRVQGSCAEVMMVALCLVNNRIKNATLIASIHDEIILECKEKDCIEVKAMLEECMFDGYATVFGECSTLKNIVEAHSGLNWSEAKG